jgi:hypothetical protein
MNISEVADIAGAAGVTASTFCSVDFDVFERVPRLAGFEVDSVSNAIEDSVPASSVAFAAVFAGAFAEDFAGAFLAGARFAAVDLATVGASAVSTAGVDSALVAFDFDAVAGLAEARRFVVFATGTSEF